MIILNIQETPSYSLLKFIKGTCTNNAKNKGEGVCSKTITSYILYEYLHTVVGGVKITLNTILVVCAGPKTHLRHMLFKGRNVLKWWDYIFLRAYYVILHLLLWAEKRSSFSKVCIRKVTHIIHLWSQFVGPMRIIRSNTVKYRVIDIKLALKNH